MGIFVTFEGGEGCGKSTQAKALWRKLSRLGIPVELTYEPGGTTLGKELRHLLKKRSQAVISPEAELLLFAASRIHLGSEVIRPSLQRGKVVICDRFADSTTVDQGYGRQVDMNIIKTTNELATQGIKPNLTILLDIPVTEGLARKKRSQQDRFESEDTSFHDRVREGYLKLAAAEHQRWLVIDATMSRAEVGRIIWAKVEPLLIARRILPYG
jgi:dTMP kinase